MHVVRMAQYQGLEAVVATIEDKFGNQIPTDELGTPLYEVHHAEWGSINEAVTFLQSRGYVTIEDADGDGIPDNVDKCKGNAKNNCYCSYSDAIGIVLGTQALWYGWIAVIAGLSPVGVIYGVVAGVFGVIVFINTLAC